MARRREDTTSQTQPLQNAFQKIATAATEITEYVGPFGIGLGAVLAASLFVGGIPRIREQALELETAITQLNRVGQATQSLPTDSMTRTANTKTPVASGEPNGEGEGKDSQEEDIEAPKRGGNSMRKRAPPDAYIPTGTRNKPKGAAHTPKKQKTSPPAQQPKVNTQQPATDQEQDPEPTADLSP